MNTETREFYTIRLSGILDREWADWFDGMSMTSGADSSDETVLSGYVADQAALHGLLNKIRDLNLRLIAVMQSNPCA